MMNRASVITKLKNETIVLRGKLRTAEELNKELRALLKSAKADGIREAAQSTRESMNRSGERWFCRVEDLNLYAGQLESENG